MLFVLAVEPRVGTELLALSSVTVVLVSKVSLAAFIP